MSRRESAPGAALAPPAGVRLDVWLWAARLRKTRSLAKSAIEDGRVRIAGQVVNKPARLVRIGDLLSVPTQLLRGAGVILLPFVAFLVFILRRRQMSRGVVAVVIALNASWVVASLLILLDRTLTPNTIGTVSIVGQAIAVAALAELQFVGLRRAVAAGSQRPTYSAST